MQKQIIDNVTAGLYLEPQENPEKRFSQGLVMGTPVQNNDIVIGEAMQENKIQNDLDFCVGSEEWKKMLPSEKKDIEGVKKAGGILQYRLNKKE